MANQSQIPHSKLSQFPHNFGVRSLRSTSSNIGICPSSISNPITHDLLDLSRYKSQYFYSSPGCSNDSPMFTECTKMKKLVTPSDISFDYPEVTMSELIRISKSKGRIFSFPNILNDGISLKNSIHTAKDSSLISNKSDSIPIKHPAVGSSNNYPKVKLDNGVLVLDDESIIMKPRREKMDDSLPVLYESTHEIDYSKLKQRKRYTVHHWSQSETHLFFKAINQLGTDFGMIQNSFFPQRSRLEIKNKFKREERQHPIRIERALSKNIPMIQFLTHKDLKNPESFSVEEDKGT